jgi:hypothetical protein
VSLKLYPPKDMADPVPLQVTQRFNYLIKFVVDRVPIVLKYINSNSDSSPCRSLEDPPTPQIKFFDEIVEEMTEEIAQEIKLRVMTEEDLHQISQAFREAVAIGREVFDDLTALQAITELRISTLLWRSQTL